MMSFMWRLDVLGCLNIGESILVRMIIVGELDSLQIQDPHRISENSGPLSRLRICSQIPVFCNGEFVKPSTGPWCH